MTVNGQCQRLLYYIANPAAEYSTVEMSDNYHPETFNLTVEPGSVLADEDAIHIQTHEARSCLITTSLAHAHWGNFQGQESLFINYRFDFVPCPGVRFKSVSVRIKFEKHTPEPKVRSRATSTAASETGMALITYEPKSWAGKLVASDVTNKLGLNIGGYQNIVPQGSMSREVTDQREAQAKLNSTRMSPVTVVWNLEENDVTHGGAPNPLEVAMIVRSGGEEITANIRFEVRLSKTLDPRSWLDGHAVKNDGLVFRKGWEVGKHVPGTEAMELENFQLAPFVKSEWDL